MLLVAELVFFVLWEDLQLIGRGPERRQIQDVGGGPRAVHGNGGQREEQADYGGCISIVSGEEQGVESVRALADGGELIVEILDQRDKPEKIWRRRFSSAFLGGSYVVPEEWRGILGEMETVLSSGGVLNTHVCAPESIKSDAEQTEEEEHHEFKINWLEQSLVVEFVEVLSSTSYDEKFFLLNDGMMTRRRRGLVLRLGLERTSFRSGEVVQL